MVQDQVSVLSRLVRDRQIDRRRLVQGGAALGLSATAATFGKTVTSVNAQGEELQLVTVSHEQQPTWIRVFNPLLPDGSARWPTHAGIYEPMMIYNTMTGEIVPWLATEYSYSDDNLQLTFTLREGVQWSDGEAFTAEDVKFTFDLLNEHTGLAGTGAVRGTLPLIESVEAPDDVTVVFTFTQPFSPALYDVAEQAIVPQHIWSEVEDPVTYTNENPVATGPFTEIGRFEDQYYEVLKNPNYWQEGAPLVDGFACPVLPNNDAANLATVNGEVDMASNFIPDIENTYIAKDPEHFHYWFPAVGSMVQLFLNTTRAPFDDVNVRKAISLGIDRDQIVTVAMYDYTHPADATGLTDAFDKWRSEEALAAGDWVVRDVERANQLLDEAGLTLDGNVRRLPDGTEMSYQINVVSGWSDWVSSCQIMAQNLEDLGITATVQTYDYAVYDDALRKGDFDMSIGSYPNGPTPFNFYRSTMATVMVVEVGETAVENFSRYANTDADELLDQFAATTDEAEQIEIANQLQMLYVENAPTVPLFPGPNWGEFSTRRFTGFPSEDDPYALLAGYEIPERLIQLVQIRPVEE